MLSRRQVLLGVSAIGSFPVLSQAQIFTGQRPAPSSRCFTSPEVEACIAHIKQTCRDKTIATLFETCFPNALDTTVTLGTFESKPDCFVITGDIDAMWLRDSSAQVWPYLPFAKKDPKLQQLLIGVIARQVRCILLDPYANAFLRDPGATPLKWSLNDETDVKPGVGERKWEIDSLCYPVRLAYGYWRATGDVTPFDSAWREAMRTILKTFIEQQRKDSDGPYHFQRKSDLPQETLALRGYGAPTKKVGLIHSGFRPSDDACLLPFLVPANHFAVVILNYLVEMADEVGFEASFKAQCHALRLEVADALKTHAKMTLPTGDVVWAYEVDGFGNAMFMDDANTPGLLGLAYLGACHSQDRVYLATRKAAWSERNPYFYKGSMAEGIGGPHAGRDMIWPMSLMMCALTSEQPHEIRSCLNTLATTTAGTGFMHESFNKDDPAIFTRKWFAWANSLFGEVVLDTYQRYPRLLTEV